MEGQTTEIEPRALGLLTNAQHLVVGDDETRLAAGSLLKMIKGLQKEVKADREPERIAAQQALDAIRNGRNRHLKPLEQGEEIIKQKVLDYEEAEEKKRQEEEDRINAQLQAEEDERRLKEAAELEELGGDEEAQAVLDAPTVTTPVFIPKSTPKVEGQHTTLHFKCRIPHTTPDGNGPYSLMPLIKAVAEGKAPLGYLSFNVVAANQEVKRIKDQIVGKVSKVLTPVEIENVIRAASYPGVEVYTEKSLASRSY